ncbi:PASTA domain-containing protein, partial [bacterium]|nr:PASTA domain-containing protein [bacterium]
FGEFAAVPTSEEKPRAVSEGLWAMPDLQGLSVRDALRVLGHELENVKIQGTGYVAGQQPAAGQQISARTPIQLVFQPTT